MLDTVMCIWGMAVVDVNTFSANVVFANSSVSVFFSLTISRNYCSSSIDI